MMPLLIASQKQFDHIIDKELYDNKCHSEKHQQQSILQLNWGTGS